MTLTKTLMAVLCALLFLSSALHARGQTGSQADTNPAVLKVEPPSWWANHTINPVRLLVRGRNLGGARVNATRPETQPTAVVVNSAGTYLFVSVRVSPSAMPGEYPLTLETKSGKTLIPFRLDATLDPTINFQGITSDDVIYLIMPDRFSNGDASNDAPAGSPLEANERRNPRSYHGGDLRGIINHLPYLKELGVTALWLTPWYDNWNGVHTCDKPWCPSTSYHGYGATDYYGVEDHFGDMQTLRELVQKAHALGLKVIQDQVANHIGVHHEWAMDSPLEDWFHGTLKSHPQNPFRGDTLLSTHASEIERRPTLDGWFADDLPDMNQEEPEVSRYEIQNALWWVGMTGVDGIREDTIQYMPRPFIHDLLSALHRQYPKMWMVGEVFDRDPVHTSFFIGGREGWDGVDTRLDSVFDFPLWQTSLDVFRGLKPVRALRDSLKYDALYPDPNKLTTMLSNHDVRRTVSLEKMTLEGAMLHTAFLLSVRGTPQLYYGDEIALEGMDDPDNRRDFPGGFPGDARDAFQKSGRDAREQRMYEWTRDWLRLRREHGALRGGRLIDLAYDDDAYVYARRSETEILVIAVNRAATQKRISFDARMIDGSDGMRLFTLLGERESVPVLKGKVTLVLPPKTVVAYELTGSIVK
ncbi:MAG TPA: alpha-amylase family glycosyl hydrolase [Pyrinomonadaceae bacterium]|jgi:glycosidase|nr:alpha-amylase family glycosyl hydrolase [Pyrinomonadaceae bacterium]